MMHREMRLVSDFLTNAFAELRILTSQQKVCIHQRVIIWLQKDLFTSFFIDFSLLETSYLTYLSSQTALFLKPNGHYIDTTDTTICFPISGPNVTQEQMLKFAKFPSFVFQYEQSHRRTICEEHPDAHERSAA